MTYFNEGDTVAIQLPSAVLTAALQVIAQTDNLVECLYTKDQEPPLKIILPAEWLAKSVLEDFIPLSNL